MQRIERADDIGPEAARVVIARIERDPGKGPGTTAGINMPGTEQGRLAPASRGNNEGECAPQCSVHPLREPWTRDHLQAGWRHRDFRREQVEGRHAGGGGEHSGSRRLRRTERIGWSWTRRTLCREHSGRFMKPRKSEFLGLAEVGFVQATGLGAVGIPVPGAMPLFAPSGQGTVGAGKGKRARSRLTQPSIPGL